MGVKMRGPFSLDASRIDLLIIPNRPGVYGVSSTTICPAYIARSDSDLNIALKHWIGKYKFFWFEYAISSKDAYVIECETFHKQKDKNKLENNFHPEPQERTGLKCPICGGV